MSMSKKIFGTMLLLIVVAVIVLGLAIYSILTLNSMSERLINTAVRLQSVMEIANLAVMRNALVKDIIISTDETEMQTLVSGEFADIEKRFQEEFAGYQSIMPEYADAQAKTRPNRLKELWAAYSSVTSQAADLALRNDNAKAMELFKSKGVAAYTDLRAFITGIVADSEAVQTRMRADADTLGDRVIWTMVGISVVGIILVGLLAIRVVSRIGKTLSTIIEDLN